MSGRTIHFVIPGRVGGKGRPRFSTRGGFVRTFTDAKTRSTEARMREIAVAAMDDAQPLIGPVSLDVRVILNPPPSWPKKRRAAAHWVTGKPDADNTLKLADSFNGVVWQDDSQIAVITFQRTYSLTQDERVIVTVTELLAGEELARAA